MSLYCTPFTKNINQQLNKSPEPSKRMLCVANIKHIKKIERTEHKEISNIIMDISNNGQTMFWHKFDLPKDVKISDRYELKVGRNNNYIIQRLLISNVEKIGKRFFDIIKSLVGQRVVFILSNENSIYKMFASKNGFEVDDPSFKKFETDEEIYAAPNILSGIKLIVSENMGESLEEIIL